MTFQPHINQKTSIAHHMSNIMRCVIRECYFVMNITLLTISKQINYGYITMCIYIYVLLNFRKLCWTVDICSTIFQRFFFCFALSNELTYLLCLWKSVGCDDDDFLSSLSALMSSRVAVKTDAGCADPATCEAGVTTVFLWHVPVH